MSKELKTLSLLALFFKSLPLCCDVAKGVAAAELVVVLPDFLRKMRARRNSVYSPNIESTPQVLYQRSKIERAEKALRRFSDQDTQEGVH